MKLGHWLLTIGAVGTLALLVYETMLSRQGQLSIEPQAITGEPNPLFLPGVPYSIAMYGGFVSEAL